MSQPNIKDDNQLSGETAASGEDNRSGKSASSYLAPLLLFLILLLGAFFRFTGIGWDDTYHLHPDERFLTDVAGLLESTDPLTYLKTSESPLNPYNVGKSFYVYGNFPMTATRVAAEAADGFCQNFQSICTQRLIYYDGIHLVGRFLSAFVDLITIILVYSIGKRLYDWRAGLFGAFLMAAAVLPIQQSHFFTMDNWAAMLTTAAIYAAVRASEDGRRLIWWLLFGFGLGLAVSSRINLAPLAVVAIAAAAVWLIRRSNTNEDEGFWKYLQTKQGSQDFQWALVGVILAAVISIVTIRLAQPYAFADSQIAAESALMDTGEEPGLITRTIKSIVGFNPQWLSNMEEIQGLQSPEASFPPALQWTARTPLIFPLTNMVFWGMGLMAGLAAIGAFLWALIRVVRKHPGWLNHVIVLTWAGLYFLFMGTRWVKSVRYFLPIYPVLFILAGWALIELWNLAGDNKLRRTAALAIMLLVAIPTLLWANTFVDIYRNPVTRVEASAWMLDNIPSGATLIYRLEEEEFEQQLPLKGLDFWPGNPPVFIPFNAQETGTLVGVRFNYLSDPDHTDIPDNGEQLSIRLMEAATGNDLASKQIELGLTNKKESRFIELNPVILNEGSGYILVAEIGDMGPVRVSTSVIANEHWDDPLPVRYEGIDPYSSYFSGLGIGQIPITNPDSEQKREEFAAWLDEADYIVLSSQRALWSLPRLPKTYPLTIRYFETLFSGELGFELVEQFHADFSVGPLNISDVGGKISWNEPIQIGWPPAGDFAVEEAFSVYDHPPVWIFKKAADFNIDEVRKLLGKVDLSEAVFMTPGEATRAQNGLQLSEERNAEQQLSGTYRELFNLDSTLTRYPWLAVPLWWIVIVILGWLSFPLTSTIFSGLPERGFLLGRIFSLLFVAYVSWLLASIDLLPNDKTSLTLSLALLILISLSILLVKRKQLISFVSSNWKYILFAELFSLALFLMFIFIRAGNPDVWDVIWGGEKPMDLSYFNAVLKSDSFPPYDPWFAGGYINYYYFGFVYAGALTELLGIPPTLAYNLLLPTLFSFTGAAAFTVAYNLILRGKRRLQFNLDLEGTKSRISNVWSSSALSAGIFAAVFCVLIGNLAEVPVMLNAWMKSSDTTMSTGIGPVDTTIRIVDGATDLLFTEKTPPIYTGDWFWSATRAISVEPGEVQPITEFPFFTFLYGDLHAHMIALPLTLMALAWAVSLAMLPGQRQSAEIREPRRWQTAIKWAAGALIVGSLWATNTWDYPTYLVIALLSIGYYALKSNGRSSSSEFVRALLLGIGFTALSFAFFWPFTASYGRAYSSFSLWQGSYTSIPSYFAVFGLFLFIAVIHVYREFRSWSRSWTVKSLAKWEPYAWVVVGAMFVSVLLATYLVLRGYSVAPIALSLTLVSGLLSLRRGLPIEHRIPLVLISASFFLTLLVEIIVLDGDIGRMNTVFKFYLQVWVMLSVALGVGVIWINQALTFRPALRRLWRLGMVLLLAAAALYPILATKAKWDIRMSSEAPITLDGMAFMQTTSYTDTAFDGSPRTIDLSYDYDAIRWMQRNIAGSPVIAEAHSSNPYRSVGNRVAMYTGLPAIIGWDWHQRQQRALLPPHLVYDRIDDVNSLYNTTDISEAEEILARYNVKYIYVGPLEWTYYFPQGLLKFDEMVQEGAVTEVYRNGGVSIYEVLSPPRDQGG